MKIETADLVRLAAQFVQKERWNDAFATVNEALNDNPESPEALFIAGLILRRQHHFGLALPILSKVLSLKQDEPNIWMNYGAILHDLNRYKEAIQAFTVVRAMIPRDPMPPANISASYVQMGKWHDALNVANEALVLDKENYIANTSAAFASLALGRWSEAWSHAEYLYGNQLVIRVYNDRINEEPLWDGSKGKCVVVQCDQGVGDIIMFSQILPQLQADCREVIIETSERMVSLMERNFPGCKVYGTIKQANLKWPAEHQIDAHVHISFLGKFYRNKDSDFPRKAYIRPDPELLDKWLKWLEQFDKPWRGLAWKGGIQATLKHVRSVDLSDYAPIANRPGTNIDLSYHDSEKDIERSGLKIVRPPIDTKNYDDTMALIAALDEVYTVTTTVAHVCGAMGRNANVLVPDVPTWRYAYRFDGGESMIWYPQNSVRLFRRTPGENDWSATIARMDKATR